MPLECNLGPYAMASDELLLELAEEGICSLRFYTWTEPTVSLGYFQSSSHLLNSKELNALPWIRRATGGEALVHHHELTYALGLPLNIAGQKSTLWQEKMHLIIQKALSRLGYLCLKSTCPNSETTQPTYFVFIITHRKILSSTSIRLLGVRNEKRKEV